jgi:hypothetical protein
VPPADGVAVTTVVAVGARTGVPVAVLVVVGVLVGMDVTVAVGDAVLVGDGEAAGVPLAATGLVATGAAALGAQAGKAMAPYSAKPTHTTVRLRRIGETLEPPTSILATGMLLQ